MELIRHHQQQQAGPRRRHRKGSRQRRLLRVGTGPPPRLRWEGAAAVPGQRRRGGAPAVPGAGGQVARVVRGERRRREGHGPRGMRGCPVRALALDAGER